MMAFHWLDYLLDVARKFKDTIVLSTSVYE